MAANIKEIFDNLDKILSTTDLSDVSSESSGFSELKDGYYLCELEKTSLKLSKSDKPMASLQLKVVEDGNDVTIDDKGVVTLTKIDKTVGRVIFINYVLTDDSSVKRFVNNMLKFEDDNGESILPKEAFTSSELIEDALAALIGMNIYVQVSTSTKDDGSKSTWNNLISWKRAAALELPM